MNNSNIHRYLSVAEIATYLGVKTDTVYKWLNNNRIPAHKVGRLWKFDKAEIDDWVKSGSAGMDKTDKKDE